MEVGLASSMLRSSWADLSRFDDGALVSRRDRDRDMPNLGPAGLALLQSAGGGGGQQLQQQLLLGQGPASAQSPLGGLGRQRSLNRSPLARGGTAGPPAAASSGAATHPPPFSSSASAASASPASPLLASEHPPPPGGFPHPPSSKRSSAGRTQPTRGRDSHEEVLVEFRVTDNGCGIPKNKLGMLFKPFSQVASDTRMRNAGTGLGLAISAALVEKMGGTIKVTSAEGRGSCFSIVVPFRRSSPPIDGLDAAQAAGSRLARSLPDGRSMPVVVAVLRPSLQAALTRMLACVGIPARVANLRAAATVALFPAEDSPAADGSAAAASSGERSDDVGGPAGEAGGKGGFPPGAPQLARQQSSGLHSAAGAAATNSAPNISSTASTLEDSITPAAFADAIDAAAWGGSDTDSPPPSRPGGLVGVASAAAIGAIGGGGGAFGSAMAFASAMGAAFPSSNSLYAPSAGGGLGSPAGSTNSLGSALGGPAAQQTQQQSQLQPGAPLSGGSNLSSGGGGTPMSQVSSLQQPLSAKEKASGCVVVLEASLLIKLLATGGKLLRRRTRRMVVIGTKEERAQLREITPVFEARENTTNATRNCLSLFHHHAPAERTLSSRFSYRTHPLTHAASASRSCSLRS